jgi:hypothetical protein
VVPYLAEHEKIQLCAGKVFFIVGNGNVSFELILFLFIVQLLLL